MLSIEGHIVGNVHIYRGRVEIGDDGLISHVGDVTGNADLRLGLDQLIFPGFIDLHVHARESVDHTQDYKEDFKTAGEAAVNGGVVAFADMPNNLTAVINDEIYNQKLELAKKSAAEVLLYAGIGPNTKPLSRKVPYKVFMGKSVGDLFFESFTDLDKALEKYRGQNISFHCEDPRILKQHQADKTHEDQRPKEAEISAVDFALQMIEKYDLEGKICHCSTMEAMDKIIVAKNKGLKVTVEVTPHHLYFDETMIEKNRGMFQVNPPIRQTKENRFAFLGALKYGYDVIDYLASDHAPHTIEEKQKGMSGLTHLDTYGPFVTWLAEKGISPNEIVRLCSYNPAQFFNQFSSLKYGQIKAGFVGSLTILNWFKPIKIEKSMLKTKAGWSPFEGVEFPGSVAYTIIRGKVYGL